MVNTDRALTRALTRARDGKALTVDEASELLTARGTHLDELLVIAGRIRDAGLREAGRPGTITYSKKVFIPLTRLCRDRCHYCTFATTPGALRADGHGMFLEPDEVLAIARSGALLGCKEALFTLGDRPELRWTAAQEWLDERGYNDTLSYVRAMAILVLEETGLLPHLNPGVMTWDDMQRLKPVAPSMGLMLEQSAQRLWSEPGAVHFGSPDKEPAVRLRVLEDAGRLSIPFTTGVLVGIGETPQELVQSLFDIRTTAREFGHVQEVIVQNFRAKPDTAMRNVEDLPEDDYVAALAVARIVLGPKMRIQAPPNLSSPRALSRLIAAGVDDWGGVSPLTPDHVNPERPWPHLDDLAELTELAGFTLEQRLTVHPEYIAQGPPWVDARLRAHVDALRDPVTNLAVTERIPQGIAWQEADADYSAIEVGGRTDLGSAIDDEGRRGQQRADFDQVYGDWETVAQRIEAPAAVGVSDLARALQLAAHAPADLALVENHDLAVELMSVDGSALEQLCRIADDVRRDAVGDEVTYIVNRNINFTNVCYTGCRFCAFAQRKDDVDAFTLSLEQVADRAEQAWAVGATEVCMQGGIHPDLPGTAYFDLVRAVKDRVPGIHVHAFSPMEVANGASRSGMSIRAWLEAAQSAGLDTIPGTAAEILDDEVRWVLTRGKLPTSTWIDVVTTAHSLGIKSSSTMMYGHVDHPHHWVSHIRLLAQLQDQSGGFTEFVPLPFVHQQSPVYLAGIARPGPTWRDNRAVHAMARLMLHGRIDHIQASWVKVGDANVKQLLRGGVDDLGGTLMEETISRMAGSAHGSTRDVADLLAIATSAGRPARQRTTTYGYCETSATQSLRLA
ncbi:MAG: bifunctional FO biosynthesis protein CofGH, partial [Actinobacteria bacterium]|nr:bifunctional FO biosynthesis protein CofGH [Actinomycetota bacterium]